MINNWNVKMKPYSLTSPSGSQFNLEKISYSTTQLRYSYIVIQLFQYIRFHPLKKPKKTNVLMC